MEKFDELLTKLKEAEIEDLGGWDESIPEDIWDEYFEKTEWKKVTDGLDVDTHRWYELSTTVIEIYGRFLGIRHVTNVFSENMGAEDCGHTIKFCEMEAVPSITYKCKKK